MCSKLAENEKHLSQIKYQSYPFKVCSKSEYKLCELCSVNMNATTSLQVGQAKQMPHVISDTGRRNYVWGDIIQLRITTRSHCGKNFSFALAPKIKAQKACELVWETVWELG